VFVFAVTVAPGPASTADGKLKTNDFRLVLLTKCPQEFEKGKKGDEERTWILQAIKEDDTVCVSVCECVWV